MLKKLILSSCLLTSSVTSYAAEHWKVLVSPFIWGASLKGDLALAGKKPAVDIPFSELVNDVDSIFMGNLELTNSHYGFYIDAINVDTDSNDRVMGQKISYKIDQTTVALGAFYRAFNYELGGNHLFDEPRRIAIDPTIGARWTKLTAEVQSKPFDLKLSKKAEWTDPFVGLRLTADLTNKWNLSLLSQVGGLDTDNKKTHNHEAYLGYRVYLLDHPTIIRVGYRSLSQRYTSTDFTGHRFKYDIRQSGPVVGMTMRF